MRGLCVLAVLLALSVGCDDCDSEPPVPFGVDSGQHGEDPDDGDPGPEERAFEARRGQSFEPGTTQVAIEGAPLQIAEQEIRNVLAVDLDEDGDRDALVVAAEDGVASLLHARRDGSSFGEPRRLASMEAPEEGCTVGRVTSQTVSPEYAVATLQRTCPGGASQSVWIVSVEAQPRLRESVTLLPEEGRAPGEVRVAMRAVDHDSDGHTDVLLDVSVTPPEASEAATASIAWLDRPGGLARDTGEPEGSIASIAQRSRQTLSDDPAQALAEARRALALHAALCREAGSPRVRFGDAAGLPCRQSEGAGRAAAVATAALAEQGEVFAALEASARMRNDAYRVATADQRLADQALEGLAVSNGVREVEGPAAIAPAVPDVHLPLIGFRDDDTLLVRGVAPAVYRVTGEGVTPVVPPETAGGDLLLTDPAGRWAVTDVQRTCEGYVLSIVRAAEVVAGVVAGRPASTPLLEEAAPPPEASCPDLPASIRDDDGGWHVVGWAPQGVVAVRRDEVRLVPLTVDAQPAGDPSTLEPGTPPPVPIAAGRMSPDGASYAVGTPAGLVVRRLEGDASPVVVRPEHWSDEVEHVAVSPSGERVAYAAEGKVHLVLLP